MSEIILTGRKSKKKQKEKHLESSCSTERDKGTQTSIWVCFWCEVGRGEGRGMSQKGKTVLEREGGDYEVQIKKRGREKEERKGKRREEGKKKRGREKEQSYQG